MDKSFIEIYISLGSSEDSSQRRDRFIQVITKSKMESGTVSLLKKTSVQVYLLCCDYIYGKASLLTQHLVT